MLLVNVEDKKHLHFMLYSGGTTDNVTYRNIGDHTEAVEVNNYDDTTQ